MRISAALLIGTSLAALASPAFAQTQQEDAAQVVNPQVEPPSPAVAPVIEEGEIIVTATKRASRVQDVPFSINAQTEADLRRANAQTLEDISRNVAGLTVQNLGPGQSQVSVRGVSAGQIARDQPGVKEQVGIYLDETITSLSLFTPDFDLFDLNRSRPCAGRRARCSAPAASAAPSATSPTSRIWTGPKARSKPTSTCSRAETSAMA